jgi:glycerol uptake facilitator protein
VARQPITRPVVTSIQDRFIAELVGTFLLTFVVAGAVSTGLTILHNSGQMVRGSDILVFALANGLALFAAVSIFGRVSGAHVNPAVTLGLASIGRFPWEDVFPYILAQFLGAILAAGGVLVIYGTLPARVANLGGPRLGVNISIWQGLAGEALGAFILVLAVVATAVDERATPGWAGLAIGMALAAGVLVIGYATGGSFNPARAFGPDLLSMFTGGSVNWLAYLVCYLVGPLIGGVAAAFAYRYVARLPRPRR